eukprot:g18944.t1
MSSYFKGRNFSPFSGRKHSRPHLLRFPHLCLHTLSSQQNQRQKPPCPRYHPINLQIQRIILRHLQSDPITKDIFPSPPLSAFRRNCSFRDSLVHSTLPTSPTTSGTFPCNRRRCSTCPYTSPLTSIQGPKNTCHIRQMVTCTSVNVVYCICCSQCGLLYIGETKQRLRDHFVEHLCSIHDKRHHLPVANHFNSPSHSHSLDGMSILGLLQYHNDATRKLEEQHLIFHLGSLQPN